MYRTGIKVLLLAAAGVFLLNNCGGRNIGNVTVIVSSAKQSGHRWMMNTAALKSVLGSKRTVDDSLGKNEFFSFTPTSVKMGIQSVWLFKTDVNEKEQINIPINQEIDLVGGTELLSDLVQKNASVKKDEEGTYTGLHIQSTDGHITMSGAVTVRGKTYSFTNIRTNNNIGSFDYHIPALAKKIEIQENSPLPVIRLIFDTENMAWLTGNLDGGGDTLPDGKTNLRFEAVIAIAYVGGAAPFVQKYRLNVLGDTVNYLKVIVVQDPDSAVVGYGWNTVYSGGNSLEGFAAPGKTGNFPVITRNGDGSYYLGIIPEKVKEGSCGYIDSFKLTNHTGIIHCVSKSQVPDPKCRDWNYTAIRIE